MTTRVDRREGTGAVEEDPHAPSAAAASGYWLDREVAEEGPYADGTYPLPEDETALRARPTRSGRRAQVSTREIQVRDECRDDRLYGPDGLNEDPWRLESPEKRAALKERADAVLSDPLILLIPLW